MLKKLTQTIDPDALVQITDYKGGWRVKEECADEQGRLVVIRLRIEPTAAMPAGGLSSRVLRGIQVGQIASMLRELAEKYPSSMQSVLAMFKRPKRRQKWARTDDRFYAELACEYVRTQMTPEGRKKPVETLAKWRRVPVKLLRSQIHYARKNGFLSEVGQGKAGGELTDKAKRVLATTQEEAQKATT